MTALAQSLVGVVDLGGNGDLALTVCGTPSGGKAVWVQFEEFDFDLHEPAVLRAVGALFAGAAAELEVV